MEFYKNSLGEVFSFENDSEMESFAKEPLEKLSASEKAAHLAPRPLSASEKENIRRAMYELESDGLFFKWQRGEIEKSVWLEKISEIKSREI